MSCWACWPPDTKQPLNDLSQTPSYRLLAGLLSDSHSGPRRRMESCIAGRSCCRQLHLCNALPVPGLPCPALCGDLPLTAALWRWEAWRSKCILPKVPGLGQCRSSPGLRWDTSLHCKEGPGTGVSDMLQDKGWEWNKVLLARGKRDTWGMGTGEGLRRFCGAPCWSPQGNVMDWEQSGREGEEHPVKAGGFGKHLSY